MQSALALPIEVAIDIPQFSHVTYSCVKQIAETELCRDRDDLSTLERG